MLRIWQKTEKQKLEPVGMGNGVPLFKGKKEPCSFYHRRRRKTTLLYEMAGFAKKRSEGTGDNFDAHLPSAEGMA